MLKTVHIIYVFCAFEFECENFETKRLWRFTFHVFSGSKNCVLKKHDFILFRPINFEQSLASIPNIKKKLKCFTPHAHNCFLNAVLIVKYDIHNIWFAVLCLKNVYSNFELIHTFWVDHAFWASTVFGKKSYKEIWKKHANARSLCSNQKKAGVWD